MFARSSLARLAFVGGMALLFAIPASAQQNTVTGRVTDATNGTPLGGVHVSVIGSMITAQTNIEGVYTLRGLAAGTLTVRARRVGYAELTQRVTVEPGVPATSNFELLAVAFNLSPVVATATGDQRRIEVGHAIAQVNAEDIMQTRAVTGMADLLTSRAAGVQVIPGTQTGAGVRVRIRGASSMSLGNDPIYVVDGIRVEGATGSITVGVGGTTPARINDLNPDEIESIEIVRGPSASTLYGTDAANGVIVIRTKRGIAGAPQWTYYTEQTAIADLNDYPTNWRGWRTGTPANTSTQSNFVHCFAFQVATGACVQDSVTSYNIANDKETTPFGIGYRQQHGIQVKGGTETMRYFLHADWEDESGRLKVPEFDQRWLAARGRSLRPEQATPNAMKRVALRSNMDVDVSPKATVSVRMGYTDQLTRLPRSDDSGVPGLATNLYGGLGSRFNTNAAGDSLFGYREVTPRDIYGTVTEQQINRVIGSVSADYRPLSWLSGRALVGLDYINRVDAQLCRFQNCPVSGQDALGFVHDNRTTFGGYSFDASATASRPWAPTIDGRTTVGVQYNHNTFDRNGATGRVLPPGGQTVSAAATPEASQASSETKTLGGYIEHHVAFQDRLFVTGAVRTDRNSAFGADFKTAFYPKLSASWVVSEESFFPEVPLITQLRLRSALGSSGVQPSTTAAIEFFTPNTALSAGEAGEQPGLVYSALGNRNLKPERSTEFELGADAMMWDGRINFELTYYNKNSKDALVSRILPPSLGTGATARFENLGHVRNWGWEALVNAVLVQRGSFELDLSVNASTNSNELMSLGGVPPIIGLTTQTREGYPLFGWWSRNITFEDKNSDGMIIYNADPVISEITVAPAATFQGYSMPRHEFAATTGLNFMNGQLRVATMIDFKGGHMIYNNTERIRCASRNNCRGLIDTTAPLWEQARTVAVRQFGSGVLGGGFLEKGDFLRLREVSVTYDMPQSLTRRLFNGRSLTASAAARNLGILWTEYTGVDPEAFGTTGNSPSEFQAFAPPTYFTLRLTFGL